MRTLSLLLVCLFGSLSVYSTSREMIIRMTKLHCPGGDSRICQMNNSNDGIDQQASQTCCMDCSCEPNCNEHENCCFSDHPNYAYPKENNKSLHIDNVKIVSENDTKLMNECLYPLSTQPKEKLVKLQQQSFWMISEVKHRHDGPSNSQQCGLIKVAPWGSLLPVSSRRTGHIYKNIVCAREHFVKEDDVVNWDAAYVCEVKRGRTFELSEAFIDSCHVQFKAPEGTQIRRSSICFHNLIDTCPEGNFNIPNDVTMNQTEIIDACTSGLLSPYRVDDMYANIFCHICNGYSKAVPYKCRTISTSFGERIGKKISGLIDHTYLKQLEGATDQRMKRPLPKMACLDKSDADTCRPRFCPTGQTRNNKGKCFYAVTRMGNVLFYIWVQLKSEDPVLSIDLFKHLRRDQLANFKSPLFNVFKISSIYYKPHNSLNVTNELSVSLWRHSDGTSLKQMVDFVRKNVKKRWIFYANNSTYRFFSSLSNERSSAHFHEGFYYGRATGVYGLVLYLTKLYFCENVRLEANEFNVSSQNIVFDKISNRLLFEAQYSLSKPEGQNATCNVCIDGSSFHVIDYNSSCEYCNCSGAALYIVIFVVVRCFINE